MRVTISFGRPAAVTCTWAAFCQDNAAAYSAEEFAAMRARLERGETIALGGGAHPDATVRRAAA